MPLTLKAALAYTSQKLEQAGVPDAKVDAEWMLCHVCGCKRSMLPLHFREELTPAQEDTLTYFIVRREKREPLQHILGTQPFCGLELAVDRRALIPREETELLAELAVQLIGQENYRTALDIGTGTGALALALKSACPSLQVSAVDISEDALSLARTNAKNTGLDIVLLKSDLFQNLQGRIFDLIVSNPPYISSDEIAGLQPEVSLFEPHTALDGGADGLELYRRIIFSAAEHLSNIGALLFEVGFDQAGAVSRLFIEAGFSQPHIAKDYAGIERMVWAKKLR